MAPVSKTKSTSQTKSDPGALICAPGLLFDAAGVQRSIAEAVAQAKDNFGKRSAISTALHAANVNARELIKTAYQAAPFETRKTTRAYTYVTDQLVSATLANVIEYLHPNPNPTSTEKIAVMAVGGYGRGEMAPFSDVDLLFLSPYKMTAWAESVVESTLYVLWDLKLKIGHATRTVDECLRLGKEDLTIRTALLEARFLTGDAELAKSFEATLWKNLFKSTGPEFVALKLEEREQRHRKQGATRFLLEPNVKEGKGGLRDLQTLFWITKYLSGAKLKSEMIYQGYFTTQEIENFAKAEDFLWTVRCHLHLCVGRAAEQLTFDNQVAIADALGYSESKGLLAVEAFMQDYFRQATHVGDLTRIFLTALEGQHVKQQPSIGKRLLNAMPWNRDDSVPAGYRIEHGRLAIADETAFLGDPINFLRIFEQGLASDILIHPDAMRLIVANLHLIDDDLRQNPDAQKMFLSTLLDYGNPERALRRMNELGVLGAFIPEFQRIVALMQFNMYHHYTVDEHTIQCISNLARIEKGQLKESLPVASGILEDGVDRKVLYVAMLLHDIGKGLPEDHSIAGARLAREIAPQLGLSPAETDTVVWLVEHHLLLSDVAQKRDLSDPRTVREFAKIVKTTSRLNLLTVLTVCDIRGVGPGTWNNWKAQLIRDLYRFTRMTLQEGFDTVDEALAPDEAKEAFRAAMPKWSNDQITAEWDRHYPAYWQGLNTETHTVFAKLMSKASTSEIAMDIKPDVARDATRACFVMQDHPGIFSRLAGALALVGANVVDARTYTTNDGFATSVFWVQDADGAPYEKSRLTRLRSMINKTLKGEVLAQDALKSRDKIKKRERDFNVPTEITFDNTGSDIYTIIEVDTRDRAGLLFDLTKTLSNNNIYIASAVIATYGEQAVDVFYVKDMFGLKLHSPAKQAKIKQALTAAIDRGAEVAMS
ncbi:[protein-PII] uridylyltransferase [Amylibacter sp. IMCC11727]|uniref:[protein-PII] uridylyltransferase n=1 Tax=Amylibacter sp. IMCC11727 TaxID=3039851 RepID=UPI00244E2F4F|nr:[protein-PII] uridylyltransferase [Amylibacter sp. IMCC11727]WGI21600.1 [protein-PII] uridylyltransferase [Amylibacter sp. IMCC11727]